MAKVIGMLVALAMFCAIPAVAFAQGGSGDDNISSGNTQNGEIDQTAVGGDASGDDDGGDAAGADGGIGGDAGNQAAICQQNAGRDANCTIDQSQRFGGDTFVSGGEGGGDVDHDNDNVSGHDDDDFVSGGGVGGGVGGGSVQSVTLARTGFDAWVLALIGGISLAGGLGLLAAQRRGRLSA